MYMGKTDGMILDTRKAPKDVVPVIGLAEADLAMAYAKDMFKRLTGYPAENRHDRGAERRRRAGAEAERAMAYAEDTFARMKGYRPEHPHDRDHRFEYGDPGGNRVAGRVRVAGREVEPAMAYAKDLFKRLKGFRARGPFDPDFARTAKTKGSSIADAIGLALARVARLIRRSVLEPYARGRRRRIAIAALVALDDRLLADIGLRRGDIEPTVDGMLARRDDASPPPVTRFPPAEERRHDLPLAA
jgi:uncharacterized protein YjiS (DUF1127 family)